MNLINKLQDKLSYRWGYVPKKYLDALKRENINLRSELKRIEGIHVDEITKAIRQSRMLKVAYEEETVSWIFEDNDPTMPIKSEYILPVEPRWYGVQSRIDIAVIQRAHEDLMSARRPEEMEYFLDVFCLEIKRNLITLMRLET